MGAFLLTEREGQVALYDLETGERTILLDGRFPVYFPTGHVIYQTVELSPDGRWVSARGLEGGRYDVWLHDVNRSHKERFTFGPDGGHQLVWSPTGEEVVFSRPPREFGPSDLFLQPIDRSSSAKELMHTPYHEGVTDWSPNGRFILFYRTTPGVADTTDLVSRAGRGRRAV